MFAVIKTGGKQYVVKKGDSLLIEKIAGKEGSTKKLETLLVADNKSAFDLGQPKAKGIVTVEIVESVVKGEKLRVTKFKPKKRYKRTIGHRQKYTKVKVVEIK